MYSVKLVLAMNFAPPVEVPCARGYAGGGAYPSVIRCPSIGCLKCVKPTENKAQKKGTSNSTQTRYHGHEETTLVFVFNYVSGSTDVGPCPQIRQGLQALDLSWPFWYPKIPSRFGGEMLQDPALNFVLSQTIVYLTYGSWSYVLIWVTPKKIDKYFCIVLVGFYCSISLFGYYNKT